MSPILLVPLALAYVVLVSWFARRVNAWAARRQEPKRRTFVAGRLPPKHAPQGVRVIRGKGGVWYTTTRQDSGDGPTCAAKVKAGAP